MKLCCAIRVAIAGLAFGVLMWSGAAMSAEPVSGEVLESIRERGFVRCGVRDNVEGFSVVDTNGKWSGFSVDFCSALAAAVTGSTLMCCWDLMRGR